LSTDATITGLIGLIGIFLTWVLAKPKQKAEVTGVISEAASTSVDTLLRVMDELKLAMDDIKDTNELLKCEIDKLVEENIHLQGQINELHIQNEKLLAENVKLRKEIHKITSNLSK
jgi:FtsZ-binding cell division protein ZapB